MRKLLINTFFLLIVITVQLIFTSKLNRICIEGNQRAVNDSLRVLITGTSHARMGLNPEYINHSINISEAAEPLFISFIKLRELLPNCDSIDIVIISCSLGEMKRSHDFFLFSNYGSAEFFKRLFRNYSSFKLSDLRVFRLNKPALISAFIRYRLFPNYKSWSLYFKKKLNNSESINYKNQYRNIDNMDHNGTVKYSEDDYINLVNKEFKKEDGVYATSKISICYLDSIALLTERYHKQLIAIGFPLHHEFVKKVPAIYKKEYKAVQERLVCRYSNLRFIDYTTFYSDHSNFLDFGHLSGKGADFISKSINDSLNYKVLF